MPITKKLYNQTQSRLLLEDDEPVELPPAEVEEKDILVQFDTFKPYISELLETLRTGTVAELVPVMMDGSTFAIHGKTRTFWVKIWHTSPEMTSIARVQVISCIPLTRGLQIIVGDQEEYEEEENE
jgi:hypothetical protein